MGMDAEVALQLVTAEGRRNTFPHDSKVFRSTRFSIDRAERSGAPRGQNASVQKALRFLMENDFSSFSSTSFVERAASTTRKPRNRRRREKRPGLNGQQGFCEAALRARRAEAPFRSLAAPRLARAKSRKGRPFVDHSTLFDGTVFSTRATSSSRARRAKAA